MPSKMKNPLRIGLGALIVSAAATGSAHATEGYFIEGNGARGPGSGRRRLGQFPGRLYDRQ